MSVPIATCPAWAIDVLFSKRETATIFFKPVWAGRGGVVFFAVFNFVDPGWLGSAFRWFRSEPLSSLLMLLNRPVIAEETPLNGLIEPPWNRCQSHSLRYH